MSDSGTLADIAAANGVRQSSVSLALARVTSARAATLRALTQMLVDDMAAIDATRPT
jgi:hypothetical protein